MALTYAGISLLVPTSEIESWIEANICLTDIPLWTYRAYPGPSLENISLPLGYYPMKTVRVNRLFWYTGAARWGYMHALVDADSLDKIQQQAFGSDCTENNPLNLVISSDSQTITVSLYLLNVIPLSGIREVNGLFLISLVDKRYFWQGIATPDFGITSSTTWTDLLNDVETALDLTITVDAISANYLSPSPDLNLEGQPLPLVFDAIAFSLGMRVILDFGGKVYVRSLANSQAALDANLSNAGNKSLLRAGGIRFPDPI